MYILHEDVRKLPVAAERLKILDSLPFHQVLALLLILA